MSRTIKITNEIIRNEIDSFVVENPGKKISIPNIGKYMRSKGYDIEDHTLRRREGIKEYIKKLKAANDDMTYRTVAVYKTLDVNELLKLKGVRLKEAITQRDQYYRDVASSAARIFEQYEKIQKQYNNYAKENKDLKQQLQQKCERTESAELRKMTNTVRALKSVIDRYINAEIANAILEQEGLLEVVSSVLGDDVKSRPLATPETDIVSAADETIDILMEVFND